MEGFFRTVFLILLLPLFGSWILAGAVTILLPSAIGAWMGLILATVILWVLTPFVLGYTTISASIMTVILVVMIFSPQGELANIMIDNTIGMGEAIVQVVNGSE